jgi:hypothetical protein
LIVNALAWEATGTAERDTALLMLEQVPGDGRITVGGDKGFDTKEFVRECLHMKVIPHPDDPASAETGAPATTLQ